MPPIWNCSQDLNSPLRRRSGVSRSRGHWPRLSAPVSVRLKRWVTAYLDALERDEATLGELRENVARFKSLFRTH